MWIKTDGGKLVNFDQVIDIEIEDFVDDTDDEKFLFSRVLARVNLPEAEKVTLFYTEDGNSADIYFDKLAEKLGAEEV